MAKIEQSKSGQPKDASSRGRAISEKIAKNPLIAENEKAYHQALDDENINPLWLRHMAQSFPLVLYNSLRRAYLVITKEHTGPTVSTGARENGNRQDYET